MGDVVTIYNKPHKMEKGRKIRSPLTSLHRIEKPLLKVSYILRSESENSLQGFMLIELEYSMKMIDKLGTRWMEYTKVPGR